MDTETFLNVQEIAAQLDVVEQTVLTWLKRGELRGYRLGPKMYRVRREDLERFLEERLVAA